MIEAIVEGIIFLLFNIILAFFGFYTGEILLFFITFGKRKIRWDFYYKLKKSDKFVVLTEFSIWVGVVFWMIIALWWL